MTETVIIGSGPSGLALAQLLSRNKKNKIIVIEKENSIGGIHRVDRVDGLFTEHGPRIYSDTYVNFNKLINEWGVSWKDLFTPYNYPINSIIQGAIKSLSVRDIAIFAKEFSLLAIDSKHGRKTSMKEFCIKNKFDMKAVDLLDRVCRLVDGGGIDRFTLYEFLQITNQQSIHTIYQPKKANDIGFLFEWKHFLEKRGVEFHLNTTAIKVNDKTLETSSGNFSFDKCVFAIPLPNLKFISGIDVSTKDVNDSMYMTYIPISFHWNEKIQLPSVYGSPFKGDWGVVWIVLSDYMTDGTLPTLISSAITYTNRKSSFTGKTANESTKEELINESWRQIQDSFKGDVKPQPKCRKLCPPNEHLSDNKFCECIPDMKLPDVSLVHQSVKRKGDKWINTDYAYMDTVEASPIPFELTFNTYTLGTQNGFSKYAFTSLESAVSNAIALYNKLEGKRESIKQALTLV